MENSTTKTPTSLTMKYTIFGTMEIMELTTTDTSLVILFKSSPVCISDIFSYFFLMMLSKRLCFIDISSFAEILKSSTLLTILTASCATVRDTRMTA